MSTIPKTRIRIAADLFRFEAFNDVLRADDEDYRPKFRAGDDIQFEIGFFNNGSLLDLSGIASVTLEIKPLDQELIERFAEDDDADNYDLRGPDLSLTPIRSKTLSASDLNTSLTETNWNSHEAGHCHALISLNSVESNIAAGDRWLTIAITTNDRPGQTRTVCAGPLRVLGGGLSQSASPEGNTPETFYNTDEADARFIQISNNLADLADTSAARANLGLGENDSPAFAGLSIRSGGVVSFNDNRLTQTGDAIAETDALNRRSGDIRYLNSDSNFADVPSPDTARENLGVYSKARVAKLAAKPFPPSLHCMVEGYAKAPLAPADLADGSFSLVWCGRLTDTPAAAGVNIVMGTAHGAATYITGGIALGYSVNAGWNFRNEVDGTTAQTVYEQAPTPPSERITAVGVYNAETGTASLYINGMLAGSDDWSAAADFSSNIGMALMAAQTNSATIDTTRSCGGYTEYCDIFNRALSPTEIGDRFGPQPAVPVVPSEDRWGKIGSLVSDANDFSEGGEYAASSGLTLSAGQSAPNGDTNATLITESAVSESHRIIWTSARELLMAGTYECQVYVKANGRNFISLDLRDDNNIPRTEVIFSLATLTATNGSLAGSTILSKRITDVGGGWSKLNFVVQFPPSNQIDGQEIKAMVQLYNGATSYLGDGTSGAYVYNLSVRKLGAVASYSAAQDSRLGPQVHDQSPNGNHSLLSPIGCTWTEAGDRGRLSLGGLTADGWLAGSQRALIPAGFRITEIIATETSSNAASNLALGTTANGTDIVSIFSIQANATESLTLAGAFVAKNAAQPVHISDSPGGHWAGASIDLTFILEKF